MKTAIRFDQGSLRKPEMLPNGFMKVEGYVARAGVLEYRNDDGSIRRELRLREDVSDPKSLAGYEGASLTDGHPTVLVDADNVRTLEDGTATSARMDGDWVVAPMVLKTKKLIGKVRSGKTGLSAGYTIKLDETPGMHPVYGRYDAIQRDIRINHIAVAVDMPRAGDGARIRMDGADIRYARFDMIEQRDGKWCVLSHDGSTVLGEYDTEAEAKERLAQVEMHAQMDRQDGVVDPGLTREGNIMDKDEQIRLLQTQLGDATKKLATVEADLKVRTDERDAATGKLATAEKLAEDAQTRLDSGLAAAETEKVKEVTVRLDEANAKIRELEGSIPERVRKRASLVTRARAVIGDDYRADALDDRTVLEAAIHRFDPKADLSKESEVALHARFDAYYDARAKTATSTARLGAALAVRTDAQRETEVDPFDPLHNGVGQYASPHAAKRGA